jgi:hypothetical protein
MNIKQLVESAAYNYLSGFTLTTIESGRIHKGIENTLAIDDDPNNTQPVTRAVPCITLSAEGSYSEDIPLTGNYRGGLKVAIEADLQNTTDSTLNLICQEVFLKFMVSDLADQLSSSLVGFTCLFANASTPDQGLSKGGNMEISLRVDLVACCSDL